jgi:hypothetical protein
VAFGAVDVFNVIQSHALASGLFERVNTHEPKNAPGNGLTCAVWAQSVTAVNSSGLASNTAQVVFMVRVYSTMLQEPQDAIDPYLLNAVDVLYATYLGDFTLGDTVRCIDVRGQAGVRMAAQAGYITQDGNQYRVMTITLPVLINDAWDEVP